MSAKVVYIQPCVALNGKHVSTWLPRPLHAPRLIGLIACKWAKCKHGTEVVCFILVEAFNPRNISQTAWDPDPCNRFRKSQKSVGVLLKRTRYYPKSSFWKVTRTEADSTTSRYLWTCLTHWNRWRNFSRHNVSVLLYYIVYQLIK